MIDMLRKIHELKHTKKANENSKISIDAIQSKDQEIMILKKKLNKAMDKTKKVQLHSMQYVQHYLKDASKYPNRERIRFSRNLSIYQNYQFGNTDIYHHVTDFKRISYLA